MSQVHSTEIAALGTEHIGRPVVLYGTIKASSDVHPIISRGGLVCRACGTCFRARPFGNVEHPIDGCPSCEPDGTDHSWDLADFERCNARLVRLAETPPSSVGNRSDTASVIVLFAGDVASEPTTGADVVVAGIVRAQQGEARDPLVSTEPVVIDGNRVETLPGDQSPTVDRSANHDPLNSVSATDFLGQVIDTLATDTSKKDPTTIAAIVYYAAVAGPQQELERMTPDAGSTMSERTEPDTECNVLFLTNSETKTADLLAVSLRATLDWD